MIETERLFIDITDDSIVEIVSEKNDYSAMQNYLDSLDKEMLKRVVDDKAALASVFHTLKTSQDKSDRVVYGAWDKQKNLIGYVGLLANSTPTPEIQIEILPQYHARGYGKEMLCAVLAELFSHGVAQYALYHVQPSNTASIALVESIGGQLVPAISEVEAILMRTYRVYPREQ